jgi:hypothetical protein
MNYTKGPWKVKHSESKNAFNVIGTVLGGNYKIARCPYPVYEFEGAEDRNAKEKSEAEANAKLIAAAPDMLETLQEVAKGQHGELKGEFILRLQKLAKAAIKKATA